MKILKIRDHLDGKFNEYIVGPKQIGSKGAYLVYGEIGPGEVREFKVGAGHEEIVLITAGRGTLGSEKDTQEIVEGEALYIGPGFWGVLHADKGEQIRYVSAGGHTPGGHSH